MPDGGGLLGAGLGQQGHSVCMLASLAGRWFLKGAQWRGLRFSAVQKCILLCLPRTAFRPASVVCSRSSDVSGTAVLPPRTRQLNGDALRARPVQILVARASRLSEFFTFSLMKSCLFRFLLVRDDLATG